MLQCLHWKTHMILTRYVHQFELLYLKLAESICSSNNWWLITILIPLFGGTFCQQWIKVVLRVLQKLQLEAILSLAELKQGLSVCVCKCFVCFWRCVLQKGHSSDHSCMGNHSCDEKCTYCSLESHQGNELEECRNLAGHDGSHDCKKKNHTCRSSVLYLINHLIVTNFVAWRLAMKVTNCYKLENALFILIKWKVICGWDVVF